MAIKQDVNVPLVVTIGIISGVFLLVLVIGTQAWYQSEEVDQAAIVADEFPHQQLIDLKATETGLINQYRWMDKALSLIHISSSLSGLTHRTRSLMRRRRRSFCCRSKPRP